MKAKLCLIIVVALFACQKVEKYEPKSTSKIPKNAFWIGGKDGGNWYSVELIHSHKNNAKISIYNDQTGNLIESKKFILVCPENTQTFIADLKEQIISYDGKRILLKAEENKKNCWLQ